MLETLQQYNKGIIALLAPALVAIGARYGLELSGEEAAILASLVTGVIVILVPNKTPAQPGDTQAYITELETRVKQAEAGVEGKAARKKDSGDSGK